MITLGKVHLHCLCSPSLHNGSKMNDKLQISTKSSVSIKLFRFRSLISTFGRKQKSGFSFSHLLTKETNKERKLKTNPPYSLLLQGLRVLGLHFHRLHVVHIDIAAHLK